jgi:hypothetical protein
LGIDQPGKKRLEAVADAFGQGFEESGVVSEQVPHFLAGIAEDPGGGQRPTGGRIWASQKDRKSPDGIVAVENFPEELM